jgi:hypothetical protein
MFPAVKEYGECAPVFTNKHRLLNISAYVIWLILTPRESRLARPNRKWFGPAQFENPEGKGFPC